MRVEDSVAQGVSFFMAELQRLKSVVDRADEATRTALSSTCWMRFSRAPTPPSARSPLAASWPSWARPPRHRCRFQPRPDADRRLGLEDVAVPVHFAETFTRDATGPNMTFDYRLRPGLATSTNASR
jgi:hypothetical protein